MVVLKYRNYMILLLLLTHTIASGKEKRLLLHSEADMATELIRLRSELANVTQQLGAVYSKYANVSQQLYNALADIKSLKSTQPIIDCKFFIDMYFSCQVSNYVQTNCSYNCVIIKHICAYKLH
jgi:hypothetical protein